MSAARASVLVDDKRVAGGSSYRSDQWRGQVQGVRDRVYRAAERVALPLRLRLLLALVRVRVGARARVRVRATARARVQARVRARVRDRDRVRGKGLPPIESSAPSTGYG